MDSHILKKALELALYSALNSLLPAEAKNRQEIVERIALYYYHKAELELNLASKAQWQR